MRKEEQQAINQCRLLLNGDITVHIIDDDGGTAYYGTVNKQYNNDLETVLNLVEQQERELKIKDEYLQLIHDIAFDYDGFNTVESLKELIDELVGLVNKAYKNDDKSVIYTGAGGNNRYNILHELIEGEEENLKPIVEVLNLAKPQIDNNEEVTAILDLEDLKSLDYLYKQYKNKN